MSFLVLVVLVIHSVKLKRMKKSPKMGLHLRRCNFDGDKMIQHVFDGSTRPYGAEQVLQIKKKIKMGFF